MDLYAGFVHRAVASVIDFLVSTGLAIVASFFISIFAKKPTGAGGLFVFSILFWIGYRCVFETSKLRATPGKVYMGLQITTIDGKTISFTQSFFRMLITGLSGSFLGLGYLIMIFTPKKQTFHDLVTGVLVVTQSAEADVIRRGYVAIWLDRMKELIGNFLTNEKAITEPKNKITSPALKSANINPIAPMFHQAKALETLEKLKDGGKLSPEEFEQRRKILLKQL